MKLYIFLLSAALVSGCGFGPNSSLKIVNGTPVDEKAAMAQSTLALIQGEKDEVFVYCTAVLIEQDVALTAAHCIDEESVTLSFGPQISKDTPTMHGQAMVHAGFDSPYSEWYHFDIAVILLDEPAPSGLTPVPLASRESIREHLTVKIAGYGDILHGQETVSNDLRLLHQAEVTIAEVAGMDELWDQGVIIYRSVEKRGACFGDSGGPMFRDNAGKLELIGLAKGGYDCSNGSGYYTNAVFWQSWIAETINVLRTKIEKQ